MGYKNSKKLFSSEEYGAWKFCEDDQIRKVTEGIESKTKISVMVDIGRVEVDVDVAGVDVTFLGEQPFQTVVQIGDHHSPALPCS